MACIEGGREEEGGRRRRLGGPDGEGDECSCSPVSLSLRAVLLCGDRFEAARLFRSGGLSVSPWPPAPSATIARVDAWPRGALVFVFEIPGFFEA
uniref:Uncharacterized protein n=1 Tax=Oryza brachyantha TaxID=4533 RepID=J3MHC2_ORYBR